MLLLWLLHIRECNSHAETRIGDANFRFGFHAKSIYLDGDAELCPHRKRGSRFHVTAVQTDVSKGGPGRETGANLAQVGAALAFVARASALFRRAGGGAHWFDAASWIFITHRSCSSVCRRGFFRAVK